MCICRPSQRICESQEEARTKWMSRKTAEEDPRRRRTRKERGKNFSFSSNKLKGSPTTLTIYLHTARWMSEPGDLTTDLISCGRTEREKKSAVFVLKQGGRKGESICISLKAGQRISFMSSYLLGRGGSRGCGRWRGRGWPRGCAARRCRCRR